MKREDYISDESVIKRANDAEELLIFLIWKEKT